MNFCKATQTIKNEEDHFVCPFCESKIYLENLNSHSVLCLGRKKLNEILCPVCLEPIDRMSASVVISCGHLMCMQCHQRHLDMCDGVKRSHIETYFEQILKINPSYEFIFKCPICRVDCSTLKTIKVYKA